LTIHDKGKAAAKRVAMTGVWVPEKHGGKSGSLCVRTGGAAAMPAAP